MPAPQTVSFTSPGFDYTADLAQIERQRKLAQSLQDQSMQQEGQQTAGGWVVPYSPMQGVGKMAQAWFGRKQAEDADEKTRTLSRRAQDDLTRVLSQASEAYTGRPAATWETASGDAGQHPAMPGDSKRAASIYMTHPQTAGMGMNMLQSDLSRERLMQALRGPQAPAGNPMAPGGASTMAAPGGPRVGGPAGGIPMEVWLQTDPSGKSYAEQLAKDNAKANEPVINRGYGMGRMVNGQYVPDQASLDQALAMERGKQGITAPFEPPVTIKLSGGQEAQLSRPEYAEFQRTGQMPARYGQQPPPQGLPTPQVGGIEPIPGAVPPQDMAAFNAVASGQVPAAYGVGGPTPQAAPKHGLGTPGLSQPESDKISQARQQAGGKAVDEAFAKDYVAFTTGGAQDAAKQLGQLKDVVVELEKPKGAMTGPFIGSTPDAVLKFTHPNAIAMRERVEEVVQRSLRVVLGAQFTEKEGERLIARAYNPNLSEKENAVRVGRLFTQLEQAYTAKQDASKFFEKNGTLEGWQGKLPSMADFDPTPQGKEPAPVAAAPQRFPRAKNPQTGAEVEWNGQAWVPVK